MKRLNSMHHATNTDSGMTQPVSAFAVSRSVQLTIFGQCYSMKNSKMPRKNAPGMLKHPKARRFEHDFMLQIQPHQRKQLGSKFKPLRAIVTVFYPSRRQDLDCELIFDLLQKAYVIRNDRYIREKHTFAEVDAKNPRCEITIEEI